MSPQTLRYGFGQADLGIIMVATSARGVAALFIGDDRARLVRDLAAAFPGTQCIPDQAGLAQTIAAAEALIDAPHLECSFALDLKGSPTELAVWDALKAIPAGETRSYGAIARSLKLAATARMWARPARRTASRSPFPAIAW